MTNAVMQEPEAAVTENTEDRIRTISICGTCLHSEHCRYRGSESVPVFECNEFEIRQFPETEGVIPPARKTSPPVETRKGLCGTCENSGNCMYADTVLGVWNCEEYK